MLSEERFPISRKKECATFPDKFGECIGFGKRTKYEAVVYEKELPVSNIVPVG